MATVTKVNRKVRGKTYEYHAVRFADPGTGKEKTRYFTSKKLADQARVEIEGRVVTGTYSGDAHHITVRTMANRWRKAGYSPRRADELRSTTAADYETALERYVLPRWGAVRMGDIRAGMLEIWRNELLKDGVGPSTVRKALLVVGILFRFAMRDHIVQVNPASFVKKPAVRTRKSAAERLTPEQLGRFMTGLHGRTRIVVWIGASTGMREGEIFGLRWVDVHLEQQFIRVCRQYTHGEFVEFPKTDAGARDIGIDAKLATELSAWKLAQTPEHRKSDSLLIATSAGRPISASNFLQRDFYPALEAAQLPSNT